MPVPSCNGVCGCGPPHLPLFYFFAERQLPQKVKIEVALSKVETLKWAYTESAPRFMTPGTYPACPLPFFWEREYAAGNPYAGRHISQRGPFSVRCSLARQPSELAKPNTPPCAMDHCPRGAGAGWHKPYCFSIDNHTSVEAPCSRAASACAITTLCPYDFGI